MLTFCFPCSPKNAASHFEDRQLIKSKDKFETKDGQKDGLENPTAAEYTGEAAKEFLKVLLSVAQEIPVPGVGPAVKVATSLIEACEESYATLERAEELKLRIKSLVIVLVNELKGKTADEIQGTLKEDIRSLEGDLKYIQRKLDEIASQHAFLIVFFRSINEEKVKKCISRLDNAMESFSLARELNDANLFQKFEQQIISFHKSQSRKLDNLQSSIDNLKAILEERLPPGMSSKNLSRAGPPSKTNIFHGRGPIVSKIVTALTQIDKDTNRPRVCLLGPGGMGKTSTALAAMEHPALKEQFPASNQVWVPCVKATTVTLLLDTLYTALGTSQNTGNAIYDIVTELKSSPPIILLLDNFETPWNIDGCQPEVERILRDIEHIPHITLFLTMRASTPPGEGINWYSFDLEAVDEAAARQIYTEIYPAAQQDLGLSELFQLIGYMPLAITLMAKKGKKVGLTAAKLMEDYKKTGTSVMGHGTDAETSMDVCIELSVDNPSMKKHPEAYELLATLALLPVGTSYDALQKWWARNQPTLSNALELLLEASLIEKRIERHESYFFVLPVIRAYVLHSSRFPNVARSSMIESACNFLNHHRSSPGDPSHKDHAAALAAEEANLQAILLDSTDPEGDVIEALLILTYYQAATRPRTEVVEHALKLARQLSDNQLLLGKVIRGHAKILLQLDRYSDALEQYQLARATLLSASAKDLAAGCLLDLVEVYHYAEPDFDRSIDLVQKAQDEFEELDDAHGLALSSYYSGIVHAQSSLPSSEAIELFTIAKHAFKDLKDIPNRARCLYYLSLTYFWSMDYTEAEFYGKSAVEEYDHVGQYSGDVTRLLGHIQYLMGDHASSLQTLAQCLESCKAYGRPLDIGQTLEKIGYILAKNGKKEDARSTYRRALDYFETTQTQLGRAGITRTRLFLRMLDDPAIVPTDEERDVLPGYYHDLMDEFGSIRL